MDRTRFHTIMPEMFATMTSVFMADAICYPMETVLHRLYIQGTRTLIDNLDNGVSAISITAKYNGFFHCFQSIVNKEGFSALYSGIGSVILQYSLQFCVLQAVRAIFDQGKKMALHVQTSPVTHNNYMDSASNSSGILGLSARQSFNQLSPILIQDTAINSFTAPAMQDTNDIFLFPKKEQSVPYFN